MSTNTTNEFPFSAETARILNDLAPLQLAWLSGYCWAKAAASGAQPETAGVLIQSAPTAEPLAVTVLSASQTGNAKSVADKLAQQLSAAGIGVKRSALKDYKAKNIATEKCLLLVTSTQGEGEVPEEGLPLYKFLQGRKAPDLSGLEYAVLGLGDSSYPQFCRAGKDFDQRLSELGAKALAPRTDADLDFTATADGWIENMVRIIQQKTTTSTAVNAISPVASNKADPQAVFDRQHPFAATLLTNQKITGRHSQKDVRHIELDLSGSGLSYQPGDALGVWFENDPLLVEEILHGSGLSGEEEIKIQDEVLPLRTALLSRLEISQNTPSFVKQYAEQIDNSELKALAAEGEKLQAYVQSTMLADVVADYPGKLSATQLANLLRPLQPRLYSISSAAEEVGEEVHLTLGALRFEHRGKTRSGAASGYLADRVREGDSINIFIESNENFRLPEQQDKPVIMIGSGTGIAPFRAFVQQRAAQQASGENWLIFGNPHFTQDFLYQLEWQQFVKEGYLHKYDFAWSRDQAQKIYVQDKIRHNADELWQWLQRGAHLYVCGDASGMAKAVETALLEVIGEKGGFDNEGAEEYLNELREQGRYQRDIY
ncbi:sulfite reductase (NADPH) alpha subunit [Mesocricetibacter intestinalis]|uniref:Sulfite reductase [NADPH] flavoprotein alpha-component n=1 Tax=Mesocricetibacter intestinalis TaxID=1521930 RepID=A0A4R6VBE5_9PAST|nr:assimilatory sulfite reductase (NADPH) flavoprotein subunit [Mesocricetibacter intestinalis]TDQ58975.1 sulfite reductase (NADPH) alpha subunit [Mesocricetibacter intestinalis]